MTPFHHLDPASVPADAALVWPWRPNWEVLPVERLEWRTSVHTSQASVEQRRALRVEPRLSMSYSHLLDGADAPVALSLLRAWQGKTWAAPAWWAASKLTVGAPTDTLALSRATSTLWQVGSRGMVYAGPTLLETFTVSSVTTSGLVLTAALTGTWEAGATVVPLHFADLPESQAVSAPVGEVLRLDVTFEVRPGLTPVLAEPADGTAWSDTFPTGAAATDPRNHLLGLEHNWVEDAKLTVSFPNDVHDPGLGLLSKRPAGEVPALSWPVRLLAENDAAVARVRQFVAAHRGRAVGFFALSPVLDVESAEITAGVVQLPSLRFHSSPTDTFVGLSYMSPIVEPETVTFRMMGDAVADATGNHALTTHGTVISTGGRIAFGADGYLTVDPPLTTSASEQWHLMFRTTAPPTNFSADSAGGRSEAIVMGGVGVEPRVILAYSGRSTGTPGFIDGTVSAGAKVRLTNSGSGVTSIYSGESLVASAAGSSELHDDQIGAWFHGSTLDYPLNADLWDMIIGTGPLVTVGYTRISVAATFNSATATVTSGDTLTMVRPRLVSPVRLAADAIEITHHSLGVAEVVLPLATLKDTRTVIEGGAGTAYLIVSPSTLGWPGSITGGFIDGSMIVPSGTATWSTLPATWDAYTSWVGDTVGPISYEHSVIDVGTSAPTRIHTSFTASGAVLMEYASSADGATYSTWASALYGVAVATGRFFKIRWTVTGVNPTLNSATIILYR